MCVGSSSLGGSRFQKGPFFGAQFGISIVGKFDLCGTVWGGSRRECESGSDFRRERVGGEGRPLEPVEALLLHHSHLSVAEKSKKTNLAGTDKYFFFFF